MSFTSKNGLKVQQNRFFSHLVLQKFLGGGPQPPLTRGRSPPLVVLPTVTSALGENRWCSMAECRTKAHQDKSPLGQKPTYMHFTRGRFELMDKPQGGYSHLSSYVGSGPASTVHPQKISGISSTPNKYLKFEQPKNILQSVP